MSGGIWRRGPWFALTLACWLFAAFWARQAAVGGDMLQLRGLSVEPARAQAIRRAEPKAENPCAFTFWTRRRGALLENPDLGRSAGAGLLLVDGDSALALPVGESLPAGDRRGVLLDRGTAYALFGDENPVGGVVAWGEAEYRVRGVFDAPRATAVLRGGGEAVYTAVTLSGGDGDGFAARHGLAGSLALPVSVYGRWAAFFASLPLWRGAWLLFRALLGEAARQRAYPARRGLLLLLCASFAWCSLRLLGGTLPDLSGLLPTRWSDFSFWARAVEGWRDFAADWFMLEKGAPDLLLLPPVLKAALGGAAACFLEGKLVNSPGRAYR